MIIAQTQNCFYYKSVRQKNMYSPLENIHNGLINQDQVSFSGNRKMKKSTFAAAAIAIVAILQYGSSVLDSRASSNEIKKAGYPVLHEITTTRINNNNYEISSLNYHPKVDVIDDFSINLDINKDGNPDTSHGRIVYSEIKGYLPDATIVGHDNNKGNIFDTAKEIEKILQNTDKGVRSDAVNISLSFPASIQDLSEITGIKLTRSNIYKYKKQIVEALEEKSIKKGINGKFEEVTGVYKAVVSMIKNIEKITSLGIPVYIGAGNEGKDSINLLSLAEGVKSVGATENGTKAAYSSDSSLESRWEDGTLKLSPILQKGEFLGYDTNEDGQVDIQKEEISGNSPGPERIAKGPSNAAPRALGEDLVKRFKN